MTTHFGASFFYRPRPSDLPGQVTALLAGFGDTFLGEEIRFQGMLSGTDKFSRLRQLSNKALEQLGRDMKQGVFSSLLVFAGPATTTQGALSVELVPANSGSGFGCIDFVTTCDPMDRERSTKYSRTIWEICSSSYGFEIWGESDSEVRSELTGVPIRAWNDPLPLDEEERLLRLQRIRRNLGSFSRGAAWGSYLGEDLEMRLHLSGRDLSEAPVERVERLARGIYLRLREQPLPVSSVEYRQAAAELESFLQPILENLSTP
ncbi:MAG TPA: hypothetical protein VGO40_23645 [Longimicrobium sp.]|jgi:hypothetical protein|nr:hypothetical protein [Longimicrobium sp.]